MSNNTNSGFQQDESSQVNIHGNNNDVNINQAQMHKAVLTVVITAVIRIMVQILDVY
ncbi:MAG: hypothetical protein WAK17_16575 [Candidatus Nitrosopolaris sp.]